MYQSEADKLIAWVKGIAIMLAWGAICLIVWNILVFLLLRFLGYRYYGFTFTAMAQGLIIPLFVSAPVFYGVHYHNLMLGIVVTVFLFIVAMVLLRIEADVWRQQNGY